MKRRVTVRLTQQFENNLAEMAQFLEESGALPQVFDTVLGRLLEEVIPNLEHFPDIGRPFLETTAHSVETMNAQARLRRQMAEVFPAAAV